MATNENIAICAKCGGFCCKDSPGETSPADWGKTKAQRQVRIVEAMISRKWVVCRWGCGEFFVRPAVLSRSGKRWKIVDDVSEGRCVFLTKNGCRLPYDKRPTTCRDLVPMADGSCKLSASSKHSLLLWSKNKDVIFAVFRAMGFTPTKSEEEKELERIASAVQEALAESARNKQEARRKARQPAQHLQWSEVMTPTDDYKVNIPEGESGNWRVEKFTVSKDEAKMERVMSMFSASHRGRGCPEGAYTRLMRGNTVIMSDTPDEIRDHIGFILHAHGRVLISGLGLGMVAAAVAKKPEVTSVTVIERSEDVIKLVAPTLKADFADKITIVQADAYEWKTGTNDYWECAWYDIWDNLCTDNLKEMGRLCRRFARRVTDFQDCWCRDLLRAQARREKREEQRSRRWF